MRMFVGYGYNPRDAWIEKDVFPILKALNMDVVHGKDLHGEVLQDGVKQRIEQADAIAGFFTLREGQQKAVFNSHIWVRDELVHALALQKPAVEIRESGVNNPPGLIGERQRIDLDPNDRVACVSTLVQAISGWSMRRLLLVPLDESESKTIHRAVKKKELMARYRTRINGVDSKYREGRLEEVNKGLQLNAIGVVDNSYIQIEGSTRTDGMVFDTGWQSADLVRIEF